MSTPTIDRLARAAYDRLALSDECWVEGCEPLIDLSSVGVDGYVNLIELVRAVLTDARMPEFPAFTALIDGMLEDPETENET